MIWARFFSFRFEKCASRALLFRNPSHFSKRKKRRANIARRISFFPIELRRFFGVLLFQNRRDFRFLVFGRKFFECGVAARATEIHALAIHHNATFVGCGIFHCHWAVFKVNDFFGGRFFGGHCGFVGGRGLSGEIEGQQTAQGEK